MTNILSKVLKQRGIGKDQLTPSKMENFTLPMLQETADEVIQKIRVNPSLVIGILYDVDVDGLASGSILFDMIKRVRGHALNLHVFMNEGKEHGISKKALDWVQKNEIALLFVVDAGSGNHEEHKLLDALGVRTVILDHHPYEVPDTALPLVTILNPVHDKTLPKLSGAGVTYRFIEVLANSLHMNVDVYEIVVGLSVISDMCSMLDKENRYYVHRLYDKYTEIPLFKALGDSFFTGSKLTLFGFKIIPFFNALIRIGQGDLAIDLMNNMFNVGKSKRAVHMQKIAIERQVALQEELMQISTLVEKPHVVLLIRTTRPELSTLNGLVANRLKELYRKDALVLLADEVTKTYKGSFRGYGGTQQDLIMCGLNAQGHAQACGVYGAKEAISKFANTFVPTTVSRRIADVDVQLNTLTASELLDIAQFNEMTGTEMPPITLNLEGGFRSVVRTVSEEKRSILLTETTEIVQFNNQQYNDNYIAFTVGLSKFGSKGFQLIRQ